jgi:AbrB family looped-hinge helix DNA binding protein
VAALEASVNKGVEAQAYAMMKGGPNDKFAGHSDIPLFCYKMEGLASKVGRRGTIVLPAKLRRRLGIEEGSFVVAEERADGILIRPATVLPVEIYTVERRAEFILNNAVDAADYRRARVEVKRMGLDPDRIKHRRPSKRG